MSMPGQHQIDAKLGNPIEHVGEISMAQKNVDRFRHHQLFNLPQLPVDVTSPLRLSSAMWLVYADPLPRLAAQYNGRTCLAQHVYARRRESPRERHLCPPPLLLVTQRAQDPEARAA